MKKILINESKMLNMVNNIIESKTGNRLKIKASNSKNKKIIRLTETQFKDMVNEVVRNHIKHKYFEMVDMTLVEDSSKFDLNVFSNLKTFKERIKYCDDNLPRLAEGTSRIVFQYDKDKVIKLAKDEKGLSQNSVEIKASNDECTPKLYKSNPKNLWLLVQYAKPVDEETFKKLNNGISMNETYSILNNLVEYDEDNDDTYTLKVDNEEKVLEVLNNPKTFLHKLYKMAKEHNLKSWDIGRVDSYGIVDNNKLVVIDYGMDNDTFTNYYDY